LAVDRKALTVTSPTVATQVDQALNVEAGFAAKIAFHALGAVDDLTDLGELSFGQGIRLLAEVNLRFGENALGGRTTNSVNVGQSYFHPLIAGEIDSRDTSHVLPAFNFLALMA
jgi:hypothetical protein